MNRDNLDKIIAQYVQRFDELNAHNGNDEGYKWRAVSCFKKNWDIDADDFADMFKRAMKETCCLIDNKTVQPIGGISELLKHDDEVEFVRECFRELFSEDNGDLINRQKRIELFTDKINSKIEKYISGSWKYPQAINNVICYLNLWRPEENFIFKASIADEWANCIEFSDDFGSGSSFSLEIYYKMCSELLSEIPNYPELLDKQSKRMASEADGFDDEFHILVYDIMYCAHTYGFYAGMPIKKVPVKERISNAIKEQENADRLAELSEKEMLLASLENELITIRDLTGYGVQHKAFGSGYVKSHMEKTIEVDFSGQEKKFIIPDSVTGGFLKFTDEFINEEIAEYAEQGKKIGKLKKEIDSIRRNLK